MASNAGDRIRNTGKQQQNTEPFKRPSGRVNFPRRMTLDLSEDQHRALRQQARISGVSASALIRAMLDRINADGRVTLKQAVRDAEQAEGAVPLD